MKHKDSKFKENINLDLWEIDATVFCSGISNILLWLFGASLLIILTISLFLVDLGSVGIILGSFIGVWTTLWIIIPIIAHIIMKRRKK